MIISMSDILCVTNRTLCRENFLERVEEIAANHPKGIILREKDLIEEEYKRLAEEVLHLCKKYEVPCILHSFVDAAMELGAENIHLPLYILRKMDEKKKETFKIIGASCHSVEEAQEAERLGCTYITAGHVFVTDCKKGLAPRGLDFLKNVVESVSIPVYGIGGIDNENINEVRNTGGAGAGIMSGLMRCENVKETMKGFEIKV